MTPVFEIVESSIARIQSFFDRFKTAFVPTIQAEADVAVLAVAERLKENVKKQFIAGTDKYGESHDKTGYTLGTFDVQAHPLGAYVIGGGGALVVETGAIPHTITAHNAPLLVFQAHDGNWVRKETVQHPGVTADPYAERAIAETDLGPFVAEIVGKGYQKLFSRLGIPY